MAKNETGLDRKEMAFDLSDTAKTGVIEGYASRFDVVDNGGDVVAAGAYGKSLAALDAAGRSVKMLWQHDPAQPIGVWDEIKEDAQGLYVKGRLLDSVAKGREAAALIEAGALDGLSIGYRTVRSQKNAQGHRVLQELELWEVSLVTFPMLPSATLSPVPDVPADIVEKLKAGDLLTAREFGKLAKGIGLSNSQADRAARVHLKGQGEPVKADDGAAFMRALMA